MKKSLLLAVSIFLVALFLVGTASAVSVDVDVTPKEIWPGNSVTITVLCDDNATGVIKVTTPVTGVTRTILITVTADTLLSVKYPKDFPGGDTTELGEYEVIVTLKGDDWKAAFLVTFNAIPEVPFGTVMATVASFGAVLAAATIKRARRY